MSSNQISKSQQNHWHNKLEEHNESFQAIGSESSEHKALRYERISTILSDQKKFSLLDVGAGFGDYFGYLNEHFPNTKIDYHGTEITPDFCRIAQKRFPKIKISSFNVLTDKFDRKYDFIQMSGLFHQHGDISLNDWYKFMLTMLDKCFENCTKGISFNVLSDIADFKREGNFYVGIEKLYPVLCKSFSRHIIIDQSYPLFEATVHVLKPEFIKEKFPQNTFHRYLNIS